MSRVTGVLSGVVKCLDDPQHLGRIKVSFDWMTDNPESHWARVVSPMAGPKRGLFVMPELGDEVLVAFDQGHDDHPYVIGYCWSSTDEPPYGANLHKRGLTTVLGHELTFDDRPGSPSITLRTPAGYEVRLDEPDGKVSVSLPNGNELTLDGAGLTVNVLTGSVDVNAMSVRVVAPLVEIDAALTTASGVLQVGGAVIANGGVVSPTYTPGIGNLL